MTGMDAQTMQTVNSDPRSIPAVEGSFDFTLIFEQSILSIAPCALLLLYAPLRLCWLPHASRKTNTSFSSVCFSKLLAAVALTGLQVALLVIWVRSPQAQTLASTPATALSLLDALAICVLSYIEHLLLY